MSIFTCFGKDFDSNETDLGIKVDRSKSNTNFLQEIVKNIIPGR